MEVIELFLDIIWFCSLRGVVLILFSFFWLLFFCLYKKLLLLLFFLLFFLLFDFFFLVCFIVLVLVFGVGVFFFLLLFGKEYIYIYRLMKFFIFWLLKKLVGNKIGWLFICLNLIINDLWFSWSIWMNFFILKVVFLVKYFFYRYRYYYYFFFLLLFLWFLFFYLGLVL